MVQPPQLPPPGPTGLGTPAPAAPAAVSYPTMAGRYLRLGDAFTIRPGIQLQIWAQASQDGTPKADGSSGDFAKNIYIRRGRLFFAGEIGTPNLTYFLLWETANDGLPAVSGTAMAPVLTKFQPFAFNDAYLDYKVNKYLSIQAGLMLPPFTRNIIQSTSTYWGIDIGGVSATNLAALQTQVLRDTGVEVKVNAADNHFEARLMASQGVRLPDALRLAGKNDPRFTAFAQYNFLDSETGYVFNGQYFGRKKILALAVGADYQDIVGVNPYFGTSATLATAIPLHGGDAKNGDDEVGGQIEYLHFHNGRIPGDPLFKQDAVLVEAGYYNKSAHMSVFGKFEGRFFDKDIMISPTASLNTRNTELFGAGIKYFIAEAAANITLQYNVTTLPNAAANTTNNANLIQLQLQLAYF